MKRDSIPVDVDDLPYQTDINIEGLMYTLTFQYNEFCDTFTVDIDDADGNNIRAGEPLLLNIPLWYYTSDLRLPPWSIIPMDESGHADRVSMDNFQKTVFLVIDDLSEADLNGNSDSE